MEHDPVTRPDAPPPPTTPDAATCPSAVGDALWRRLARYDFDGQDSALPFSARLARENGWETLFTHRVIEEYRRFVFLALRTGHPVTPSDAVDQVWHLHLLYTEDYWQRFCPEFLQRALHHTPTEGGESERAKFRDWYARTLASYQAAFGTPPPEDIWPDVQARFEDAAHFRRLNMRQYESDRKWARLDVAKDVVIATGMIGLLVSVLAPAGLATWLVLALSIGVLAAVFADFRKLARGLSRRQRRLRTGDFDSDAADAGCSGGCGGGCGGG